MQAAKCSLAPVEGNIALYQFWVQSAALEFRPAPGACKKTALVQFRLEINLENSRNPCFMEYHGDLLKKNSVSVNLTRTSQGFLERRTDIDLGSSETTGAQ
jgi:hypothetical protein